MARRGRVRMRERESISGRAGVVLNIVSRRVFVGWLRGDGDVRRGEEQAEEEEEEGEEEEEEEEEEDMRRLLAKTKVRTTSFSEH
jgi:hypothetical protein